MNNSASILVLLFLAVTFVQSAYEKVFGWNATVTWMKELSCPEIGLHIKCKKKWKKVNLF